MTEHLRLIARQLAHLQRMREYLAYSTQRAQRVLPITNWRILSAEQHETLAAFRVRFSEYQEHLGKTMRLQSKKRLRQNDSARYSPLWKNWVCLNPLNAGNLSVS